MADAELLAAIQNLGELLVAATRAEEKPKAFKPGDDEYPREWDNADRVGKLLVNTKDEIRLLTPQHAGKIWKVSGYNTWAKFDAKAGHWLHASSLGNPQWYTHYSLENGPARVPHCLASVQFKNNTHWLEYADE